MRIREPGKVSNEVVTVRVAVSPSVTGLGRNSTFASPSPSIVRAAGCTRPGVALTRTAYVMGWHWRMVRQLGETVGVMLDANTVRVAGAVRMIGIFAVPLRMVAVPVITRLYVPAVVDVEAVIRIATVD